MKLNEVKNLHVFLSDDPDLIWEGVKDKTSNIVSGKIIVDILQQICKTDFYAIRVQAYRDEELNFGCLFTAHEIELGQDFLNIGQIMTFTYQSILEGIVFVNENNDVQVRMNLGILEVLLVFVANQELESDGDESGDGE